MMRHSSQNEPESAIRRAELTELADLMARTRDDARLADERATEAAGRESELPEIDADELTGLIDAAEAQRRRRDIQEALARTAEERDRTRALVATLERRVVGQAEAVREAMIREAVLPVAAADERIRQLEHALDAARAVRADAVRLAKEVEVEGDELLRLHDPARAGVAEDEARRKRDAIVQAVRNGSEAFVGQLPAEWRDDARRAINEHREQLLADRRARRISLDMPAEPHGDDMGRIPTGGMRRLWDADRG